MKHRRLEIVRPPVDVDDSSLLAALSNPPAGQMIDHPLRGFVRMALRSRTLAAALDVASAPDPPHNGSNHAFG